MSELDPDDEELSFLLRSIDDLEREFAAGDVDEHDYATLMDDYTARAAASLRTLSGAAAVAAPVRRPSRGRAVVAGLSVVAFAVLAGLLVAQSVGRRDPGQVVTGDIRQSTTEKLNEASRRGSTGDLEGAVGLYDEVLADDPSNVEALTYRGWMLTLGGKGPQGLTTLLQVATANPTYPDVHAFLAIVFFRNGLAEQAGRELDRLDALNPPPAIAGLTVNLRAQVEAALRSTTSTTATQPG